MKFANLSEKARNELMWGLPSLQIRNVVSTLAISHPNSDYVFVIKNRQSWGQVLKLSESDFVFLDKPTAEFHWENDFQDLHGKHVVVPVAILNTRAQNFMNDII